MAFSKISEVSPEHILFTDGTEITYDHYQNCCEINYADFEQIDNIAMDTIFETDNLMFQPVDGYGFRFGNENKMFFVPCYSKQNGYYSDEVAIYVNGKAVLYVYAEEIV